MNYYLDCAATTRPYKQVVDVMADVMYNHYGNPSSVHDLGQDARNIIENVRDQISDDINCDPEEVIFVSGACEANSLALTASDNIVTTRLEHKSIELAYKNFAYLDNDTRGNIILNKKIISQRDCLISVHGANSEIGVVQDIKSISNMVHRYNNILHIDATQLYPERRLDVKKLGIDLMSVSAQKFNGPRGAGFLYCKKGVPLKPLIYGSQESKIRGGTYNTPAIAGMGKALELTRENQIIHNNAVKHIRDNLAQKLLEIPGTCLNGPMLDANRLLNNISLCIDGVIANNLVTMASLYGIYISAGSACSAGEAVPSTTLKAIGLTDEEALSTIRITVDDNLSEKDINNVVKTMINLISQLRATP